mgnify:FL=1|tara:strand:+ start:1315 stop:1980 length:666 start_codon:yes stop_codon:yes gene_type:complete
MKIALCLSGYFDSLVDLTSKGVDGFDHLKRHVFSKGDVDVYIHSWDLENEQQIKDLYNPKCAVFESQIDFSNLIKEKGHNKIPNPPRTPQTIYSHFYSTSQSFKLIEGNYDWVIKSRFDIGRINRATSGPHNQNNPYPVQCINFNPILPPNKLYMANWQYLESDGPADMWFYGGQDIMKPFSTIFDNINNYFKCNAIHLYKNFMVQNGMWDNKILLNTIWE